MVKLAQFNTSNTNPFEVDLKFHVEVGEIQICQMFNLGFHSNGIKTDKVSSESLLS